MISTYRLKPQITRGIVADAPVAQAAEIASLINATAFVVDIMASSATFTMPDDGASIVVNADQVVSVTDGVVSVRDRSDFYELFEPESGGH